MRFKECQNVIYIPNGNYDNSSTQSTVNAKKSAVDHMINPNIRPIRLTNRSNFDSTINHSYDGALFTGKKSKTQKLNLGQNYLNNIKQQAVVKQEDIDRLKIEPIKKINMPLINNREVTTMTEDDFLSSLGPDSDPALYSSNGELV